MKRYSVSVVIKEIEVKITMKCCCQSMQLLNLFKILKIIKAVSILGVWHKYTVAYASQIDRPSA